MHLFLLPQVRRDELSRVSHLVLGDILFIPAAAMAVGVIVGAQVGAAISRRTKGRSIVRILSLALVVVGLRLLYGAVA